MENSEILNNLINAYLNNNSVVESNFIPEFIYNVNEKDNIKKVFYSLKENLLTCEEFYFSIAFITDSGLSLLKEIFKELQNRNPQVHGTIITSNYLCFTEPKALKELQQYSNIDVRLFYINSSNNIGFHTKGYIFKFKNNEYKAIIGSSNLTQSALTTNNEWNNLIIGNKDGKIIKDILNEYDRIWKLSTPLSLILDQYQKEYESSLKIKTHILNNEVQYEQFKPNSMQMVLINRLNESINKGDNKGLLISSTGTGKTFASAFAIKSITKFKINKLLYISHRDNILKQSLESYKKVFGNEIKMKLLSGNNHDFNDAQFIFSNISTLGKDKYYNQFNTTAFDFIVIDECHRIGENTLYQNILNYFKPKYILGMSATPDRLDGYDIYKIFDNNILYEIRLYDALEANMLVPFHYFGVSDLVIDNITIDDKTSFKYLTCDERVNKIIQNSRYYGYSGPRLKCLLFVSNKEEGKELSIKINQKGIKCIFLSGEDSLNKRNEAISLLEENDLNKKYLEMIITCDIFNEGIDIPSINQVIFLRPTKSSIIFIQQLGRGLRLDINKEYLTVIDFIGNYQSNFLIPETFATKTSGQKHSEKDLHPLLPGSSIIQFDEISTKRIIESLASINNTEKRRIKEQYINIKNRLGKIPSLIEFDLLGNLSGRSFLDFYQNGYDSYYNFLSTINDEKEILNINEKDTLIYLSRNIGSGLRIYEALLIKMLIFNKKELDFADILNKLGTFKKIKYCYDSIIKNSILSVLNTSFGLNNSSKLKPLQICKINDNNEIILTKEFLIALNNKCFKKYLLEIINYSLYSHHRYFKKFDNSINNFVLYEKYTRKDVCYLINNPKNEESTIYGYKIFKNLNIVPIFVTYHKDLDDDASINYKDIFLNPNTFLWDSKSNRTLKSEEIKSLINIFNNDGRVLLFIKRDSVINKLGESKDKDNSFYYLGQVKLDGCPIEKENGNIIKTKVVQFKLKLEIPVKNDLYNYLISKPLIIDSH